MKQGQGQEFIKVKAELLESFRGVDRRELPEIIIFNYRGTKIDITNEVLSVAT